jgi:hypothetical protein
MRLCAHLSALQRPELPHRVVRKTCRHWHSECQCRKPTTLPAHFRRCSRAIHLSRVSFNASPSRMATARRHHSNVQLSRHCHCRRLRMRVGRSHASAVTAVMAVMVAMILGISWTALACVACSVLIQCIRCSYALVASACASKRAGCEVRGCILQCPTALPSCSCIFTKASLATITLARLKPFPVQILIPPAASARSPRQPERPSLRVRSRAATPFATPSRSTKQSEPTLPACVTHSSSNPACRYPRR